MPKKSSVPAPNDQNYAALLSDLKVQIRDAQLKAAIAVNQELTSLYWKIGHCILARQKEQGWGSKVIDRLAQDLKREFPEMKGFSRSNLKYMRAFAEAWPHGVIGQRALANLPWRQNIALLEKLEDPIERLWYAQKALVNGWSRSVLVAQIESRLYQQGKGVVTNFERTLPQPQSDLAQSLIKDPYCLDFLLVDENVKHQDLKRALVEHMRDFLIELGVGFSFVGYNYHVEVGDQDYYLDLLFFHLKLRCFVVIDLQMGDFKPEHSGMMNFYLAAIDGRERAEYDQPAIGIILCKSRHQAVAEYALSNLRNPIAVATHQLPKALPSIEQLQSELENAAHMIEGSNAIVEVEVQSDETAAKLRSLVDAALEVQRALKLLAETNPTATEAERRTFVTLAIPTTLRQQAISALPSLDKTALQGLLEADYVDTAIAVIEYWRESI